MTFPVKLGDEKHESNTVKGTSVWTQLPDPPPVDQTGYAPALTMLFVKLKFGIFGLNVPPALSTMESGKAVT